MSDSLTKSELQFQNFFLQFVQKCNKKNIWYSLDNFSLFGLVQNKKLVPHKKRLDVFMFMNDYLKFRSFYPRNFVDQELQKKYNSYAPSYVEDNQNWHQKQLFIRIRIIVPTTTKKLQKYSSLFNFTRQKLTSKKNFRNEVSNLESSQFDGYYFLTSHFLEITNNWYSNLNLELEKHTFFGIEVNVIKDYKKILIKMFGQTYLDDTNLPRFYYNYPAPLKKEKIGV